MSRLLAVVLAVLTACSSAPARPSAPVIAGWQLEKSEDIVSPQPPPGAPAGVLTASRFTYTGERPLLIVCYRTASQTVAFELEQKWRREPDTSAFHVGALFFVIAGAGMTNAQLNAVADDVQKGLKSNP